MWKMFDDIIECNECGGPLGPPPKFMVPPPPRPPSMASYDASTNCNEEEMALKAQQAWDNDMCEAIPILDASLYSSQSLQTSAMIAVFSLLLVLVVLISSLFVWKNKRKVQNLLPCKTPTRGPHISGALSALASGHSVTYEDPDAHLGHHRPLVMRHHHNVELLHGKGIHYPSGYPMTRSPPFLVSNSPGPDPYRSNDNVYEELGPSHDSDGESDPPMHSDDDFAEDELSLPGERSFNKSTDTNATNTPAVQDKIEANTATSTNGPERHSVLSSASSTQDASTATAASSSSSHNNNTNSTNSTVGAVTATSRSGTASLLSGMLRNNSGRKISANGVKSKNDRRIPPAEDLNTSTSTAEVGDLTPMQQMYDNTSNLMALGYQHHQQRQQPALNYPHPQSYHHSLHHMHNQNNNRNPNVHPVPHFYNTIESEVERRNRINIQLKNSSNPAVATIFRERIQYPSSARYPQHYYGGNAANGLLTASMRARTNPRSMDRRRGRVAAPLDPVEPAYGYADPVYHHNYHYESCNSTNGIQQRVPTAAYPTYIMPEYSSGSLSSYRQHHHHHPASQTYQNSTSLYGHGDSSFGSDSGYSHHTPASSIGRQDYDIAMPIPPAPPAPTQKPPSKLANALSFSWNKKKSANTNSMNMLPNTNKPSVHSTSTTTGASSPNNNSCSSTITSTLENTSSSSSTGLQSQNNNELVQA
ncbi:GATA zinc finger domain-containing protein 7 [Lucilia sericata]|uniref:GATA zinc finger domain-containing protein 7 n=1 Tax=Lucilia sericata TaxID=13632 RepID=UPI0018A8243B|nr:GATA zinc finger domain-containing protein 7 [Lucilia sericata]